MTTAAIWLAAVLTCSEAEDIKPNPRLLELTAGQWVKLHEQNAGSPERFMRQAHGGSCFDSKRGKLVLFGSNTHGKDWKNSPRIYDPIRNEWRSLYRDDPLNSYAVSEEGLPVAGPDGAHPWAMHTFGGVLYDTVRDEMVVVCHPGHMVPGRFTNSVKGLWGQVKRHPTWTFSFETQKWEPLPGKAVSFFPYAAAWDSDRGAVIGYRPDGVYELSGEVREWKRMVKGGLFGWHNNCAYDSKNKALIVFGTNKNSNDIAAYWPEAQRHRRMPTPGNRPPKDQHNPMAFVPEIAQTVILVDRTVKKDGAEKDTTETWTYDLVKDAWTHVPTATLPFACGMNYNVEYDSIHRVLLLVTGGYSRATAVWALKLRPRD